MAFADAQANANILYADTIALVTVGEAVAKGDILGYSSGKWVRALATVGGVIQARCVATEDGASGARIFASFGRTIIGGSRFSGATVGGAVYVDEGTAYGKYTQTAPSTTGDANKIIGYATNVDALVIEPFAHSDSVA